jgi:hypothetical protein
MLADFEVRWAGAALRKDILDVAHSLEPGWPLAASIDDCEHELVNQFGSAFPMPRFRSRWSELWRLPW